jgi:hypothetical protein
MLEREIEPQLERSGNGRTDWSKIFRQMDADGRRWSEEDVSFIYQLLAKNEFNFESCLICVHPVYLTPLRSVHVRCATIVVCLQLRFHALG